MIAVAEDVDVLGAFDFLGLDLWPSRLRQSWRLLRRRRLLLRLRRYAPSAATASAALADVNTAQRAPIPARAAEFATWSQPILRRR
jgi:hypothetical protein